MPLVWAISLTYSPVLCRTDSCFERHALVGGGFVRVDGGSGSRMIGDEALKRLRVGSIYHLGSHFVRGPVFGTNYYGLANTATA